ncbi:hypothetical protein BSLA_02r4091 [Burkholderia stabilis]|nr:hypothetical protein BSLA_02r4091 [Burkholderia stabilis]
MEGLASRGRRIGFAVSRAEQGMGQPWLPERFAMDGRSRRHCDIDSGAQDMPRRDSA